MRRIPVDPGNTRTIQSDTAQAQPHIADFGDGPVRIYPTQASFIGTMQTESDETILITLICHPPVKDAPPVGMTHSYSTEEARGVAAALIAAAEQIERAAAEQASAALRKAAGK